MPVATVTRGKPGHVPLRGLSALHPVARAEGLRSVRLGDGGRRAGHCWGRGQTRWGREKETDSIRQPERDEGDKA